MTNHFHLLIQPINSSLSKMMQWFKRTYSAWLNLKYSRVGHSFQGRFHSIPVETDAYFTTVSRYIHLNPVRAGIVQRPEEYPWSNYQRLLRYERDPLVDTQFLLDYFGQGGSDPVVGYKRFVDDQIDKPEPITLPVLYRMRSWGAPPLFGTQYAK
jgi:hypothetical protein